MSTAANLAVFQRIARTRDIVSAALRIALGSRSSFLGSIQWIVALLLLFNIRSFPFAWHVRIFMPVIRVRLSAGLLRVRTLLKSPAEKRKARQLWLDSISPIGVNPFDVKITYSEWAGPDESDFNLHLSNSSYPKVLDAARFKAAVHLFPRFLGAGGIIPLGATHFHFIREIPMFSSYSIHLTAGSWDEKWYYVMGRFVTRTKSKGAKGKDNRKHTATPEDRQFNIELRVPPEGTSTAPTPLPGTAPTEIASNLNAVDSKLLSQESLERDGWTLHAVCISRVCFKIGRITVPPAIVMASNGSCAPGHGAPYSQSNRPPVYEQAHSITHGSARTLRDFYKGGWRNVPEGEQWWKTALEGVESQRKEQLAALTALVNGMESARAIS